MKFKVENIQKILDDAKTLVSTQLTSPRNYPQTMAKAFQHELRVEINFLETSLKKSEKKFKDDFKARCLLRLQKKDDHSSLYHCLVSPANELYFTIAKAAFDTNSIAEVLEILGVDCQKCLSVNIKTEVPAGFQGNFKLFFKANRDNFTLDIKTTGIQHLQGPVEWSTIEHLIIVDGVILDCRDIANLPLSLHAILFEFLRENYPKLLEALINHNHDTKNLQLDIDTYNGKGLTPLDAISKLISGLMVNGQQFTGEVYARDSAWLSFEVFMEYFKRQPNKLQKSLLGLTNGSKKLEQIINEHLHKGDCVEIAAALLKEIIAVNKGKVFLHEPENIKKADLHKLMRKYRKGINARTENYDNIPVNHLISAIKSIRPKTNEDIVNVITNFPTSIYNELFAQMTFEDLKSVVTNLRKLLALGFFNDQQVVSLAEAMLLNRSRFSQSLYSIIDLFKNNQSAILKIISHLDRKTIRSLVKEKSETRLGIISLLVNNPDALKEILKNFSDEECQKLTWRSEAKGNTVLHFASRNYDSFAFLIAKLPEKDRIKALQKKNKYGVTVLHEAAKNFLCFRHAIELYPEQIRLEALNEKTNNGDTVLYCAAKNHESLKYALSLYRDNEKLAAVKVKNRHKETLLHLVKNSLESLQEIIQLYPEQERLTALLTKANDGTVLGYALDNPQGLLALIQSLPKKDRLEALMSQNNKGSKILLELVRKKEKTSLELIDLLTPEEKIAAVLRPDNFGNLLVASTSNEDIFKHILAIIPIEEQLSALRQGKPKLQSAMYRAVFNTSTLEVILKKFPLESLREAFADIGPYGNILHEASRKTTALRKLLDTLPREDSRKLISVKNQHGETVLDRAKTCEKSLRLLLEMLTEEERVAAVMPKSSDTNMLHANRSDPQILKLILEVLPMDKRYAALIEKDTEGKTMFELVALGDESISFQVIMDCLPIEDRIRAVDYYIFSPEKKLASIFSEEFLRQSFMILPEKTKIAIVMRTYNEEGNLLHILGSPLGSRDEIRSKVEKLKIVLEYIPENIILEAVKQKNDKKQSVLHLTACNSELLEILLGKYPNSTELKTAIEEEDVYSHSVVYYSVGNHLSLSLILQIYSETESLPDLRQNNLLHQAASAPESLRLLLDRYPKAEVNQTLTEKDNTGNTVFHYAARCLPALKMLLEYYPANKLIPQILEKNNQGDTMLHLATECNEALEILLNKFAPKKVYKLVSATNNHGFNVLDKAIAATPFRWAKFLNRFTEQQKFDLVTRKKDKLKNTFLHDAAENFKITKALISVLETFPKKERVTLLFQKNERQQTVLELLAAVDDRSEPILQILQILPKRYRFRALKEVGSTALPVLHIIAKTSNNRATIAKVLCMLGQEGLRNALKMEDKDGNILMHYFPPERDILALYSEQELLMCVRHKNNIGDNPLHVAITSMIKTNSFINALPEEELIKLLYEKGSDGLTLLQKAVQYPDSLFIILSRIPKIKACEIVLEADRQGHNLLDTAAQNQASLRIISRFLPKEEPVVPKEGSQVCGLSL